MLFSSCTIVVFTFICTVVGKSNENYQPFPLRFDQAAAQIQLTQTFLSQNLNFNFNENLFSSNAWTVNTTTHNSSQCSQEFADLLNGTQQQEIWAMKLIDAWGKPLPSGVLTGNMYWVGNYDECLNPLYQIADKSFLQPPFASQYCAFFPQSQNGGSGVSNIVVGLCVPKSCSKQELAMIANELQAHNNFTDENFVCSTERRPFSAGPIVTVIILALLLLLLLGGTVVDLMLAYGIDVVSQISARTCHKNQAFELASLSATSQSHTSITTQALIDETASTTSPSSVVSFIVEFSVIRSLRKIFTIAKTEDKANYSFLNGLRVLALIWIILGHSLLFGRVFGNNMLEVLSWRHNFAFLLITDASLSVDTFFTLSGFLTAIMFVKQVENNKSNGKPILNSRLFLMYYLHRYLRLTPTLMLVILVSFNLTPYFGRGPLFPSLHGFEPSGCSQYWWTNLFYVNNLIKPQEMCLGVSWYLANDMQFHWIAPLALVPFALKRKRIAFLVVGLFILISVISIPAILISDPKMSASLSGLSADTSYFNKVYITPWCRITAYGVGLFTGFIVINTGRTYRLNVLVKLAVNTLVLIIAFICISVPYWDAITPHGLSQPLAITFQSVNRTLWSIVIGWLVFLCSTDNAKLINKILSWPIFVPLARLNYSAYLIHTMIIYVMVYNRIEPIHFQTHVLVQHFVSNTFLTYTVAIAVVLLFEAPFFAIEKKLFKH